MSEVHHINCGTLVVPGYPTAVCHCLLLEDDCGLALIDTGIGLLDVRDPVDRLGQELIDLGGFQFNESDTAIRQIENLGLQPDQLRHIVLTHCDPDHTGGLADFPNAQVHVGKEELSHVQSGHWRYVAKQFEHSPKWMPHEASNQNWYGLEARTVQTGFSSEILLIPLFGHTLGHCGVAIQQGDRWLLHVGDAYYLRVELTEDDHPVSDLAAQRADNDHWRRESLSQLRRLFRDHSDEIEMIGYHDVTEFSKGFGLQLGSSKPRN
ncbi:MBL fold metallo-hydrolase [Neorhodopirellula pilleata]|uniref:Metallo-beta-lactamase superfamily protein n=1 Tax=Neorhodopirellula pilleata TaxID=2714738 RepID=A0A5C6AAG6_9BACT|nr:MBL fold metallo-hydrolase [Neorhodopirellula pilleata]TWT96400.1 Metallo-beta-lactamase superfamily protein [Neorhodopirellula pilleata]